MHDFHICIGGDDLGFHASHFIVWRNGECERLHGHGYRVAAEIHGPLDEDQCVFDFRVARDALKKIVAELDHRVLLPSRHPNIGISTESGQIEAVFAGRRWVFPEDDCLLLPIANTTTELLAEYVAQEEMGRSHGFWWSRDGKWLAFTEVDETHIVKSPVRGRF